MPIAFRRTRNSPTVARRAIADFVDANVPRFSGWLEQVAGGIPQYDKDGNVMLSPAGQPLWLVKPDPATAMKLVADICEYHLPKLSRAEVNATVETSHLSIEQMTSPQLQQLILEQLGLGDLLPDEANIIDVEPVVVPDWLKPIE